MAYRAATNFKDLRDDHEYKTGDKYPHVGEADPERVKQLMTPTAQRGALIEEVTKEVAKETTEEKPASNRRKKKED